jgi:hypothetical protein
MAAGPFQPRGGPSIGAQDLRAGATAAAAHARALGDAAARDLAVPEALRLDERTRAGVLGTLEAIVTRIERSLIAAVAPQGFPGIGPTLPLLHAAGLATDPTLIDELLTRVRLEQLAEALPHHASDDPNRPSLLNRLAEHPAPALSTAARALLLAESRARSPEAGRWQLPPGLHVRLLWWVAAAMRERAGSLASTALDEALCAAVRAEIGQVERGADAQVPGAALALVAALDPQPHERGKLLGEALRDRRLSLFLALIAHAANIGFTDARVLVLDAGAERLLLVLHALAVPREAIAELCVTLCNADPRRDLARLADAIDLLAETDPAEGRDLIAQLWLDPDYRAARAALHGRGGG